MRKNLDNIYRVPKLYVNNLIVRDDLEINAEAEFNDAVIINGNLTVNGSSTFVNTENLEIEDPLFLTATENSSDIIDLGWYSKYTESSTVKYTGLFRDASDSTYKLFSGLETQPTTTVDVLGTGFGLANLSLNQINASNVIDSSLTANRLIASNGSNSLISTTLDNWVTGTSNQVIVTNDGDGTVTLSLPQNISTSSAVEFSDLTVQNITITDTTNAGSSSDGVLGVRGGAKIDKDLWVTQDIYIGDEYKIDGFSTYLQIKNINSAQQNQIRIVTQDNDGTDSAFIDMYSVMGSNSEYFRIGYQASTGDYEIKAVNSDLGVLRDIYFRANSTDIAYVDSTNEKFVVNEDLECKSDLIVADTLYVDSSNDRVGIGTTSPLKRFHIKDGDTGGAISNTTSLIIENNGNTNMTFLAPNDADTYIHFADPDDNSIGRIQYNHANDKMWLYVNNANALSINSTQQVNVIDTTASSSKTTGAFICDGGIGITKTSYIGNTSIHSEKIEINTAGSGNRNAYIDFVGDDTYTDYAFRIIRNDDGANSSSKLIHKGTGDFILETVNSSAIKFETDDVERMSISSSGIVTITDSTAADGTNGALVVTGGIVANPSTFGNTIVSDSYVEINRYGSGDRNSFVDFVSDDTNSGSYSARLIRNSGENGQFTLLSKGTGSLIVQTTDAADIKFQTDSVDRLSIGSTGDITNHFDTTIEGDLDVSGINYVGNTRYQSQNIQLNRDGSGNRNSYIDYYSSDSGAYDGRMIRWQGENGRLDIVNRGTGQLRIATEEVASLSLRTNNTERLNISSGGDIDMSSTTDSSSKTTGALTISGGVGIEKKLYVGTGLYLPSDGSASELNHYQEGTSEVTFTTNPYTSNPTVTFEMTRIGNIVNLRLVDTISGSFSSSSHFQSGAGEIPPEFRPNQDYYYPIRIINASSDTIGMFTVSSTGQFFISGDYTANGNFTSGGLNVYKFSVCYDA